MLTSRLMSAVLLKAFSQLRDLALLSLQIFTCTETCEETHQKMSTKLTAIEETFIEIDNDDDGQ